MDHVFKGVGLGEAYGLGNDAGADKDKITVPVESAGDKPDKPVHLHVWEAPNGSRLLVAINFRCPDCGFPMYATATQVGVSLDDTNSGSVLSMRQPVACPAHWEHVNEYGQTTGRQVKCGWTACIRENTFHHPRCICANFRQPNDSNRCSCSALVGQ
jgi:hypothetical protein